jgi:hypothetical protein
MTPGRCLGGVLVAAVGFTITGCGGESSSAARPSVTPLPTIEHATSAAPTLTTDERLKPDVRYADATDFDPPVSVAVPTGHWYPYLRGNGALSLRVATGPGEDQALGRGVEVVQASGTVPGVINQLFSSDALHAGRAHSFSVAGLAGRWYDVAIVRKSELSKPDALLGEQVEPAQGMRVFAFGKNGSVIVALVLTEHHSDLVGFLPEATKVVKALRVGG